MEGISKQVEAIEACFLTDALHFVKMVHFAS